ncbi:small subunit ribosomal protein S25e [Nematocida displodere]|uniref:40S ribosomal protein S25 n=1 Tax=Nematocida displodere TaxID=1805483 RepID=A0A177EJB5_9MICR|nr:small subunit ribosomal protein S25e [Nematocida displodere]
MAAKKVDPKAQKKTAGAKVKATKKKEPKKWVKTTVKETTMRNVIINEESFNKIKKEVLGMTVISPSNISTKNNITVSLAKRILSAIVKTGEIEVIAHSSFGSIYGKKEAKVIAEEVVEPAQA